MTRGHGLMTQEGLNVLSLNSIEHKKIKFEDIITKFVNNKLRKVNSSTKIMYNYMPIRIWERT